MARCPNCGRETARTEDWSCQWCGYPLLSGSYKKIAKTYRELKEERLSKQPVVEEAEPEPVLEAEIEPVSEPEPEAVAEPELAPEAVPEPVLEAEPEPISEAIPESVSEPEPAAKPKPRAKRKPAPKSKAAAKAKPAAKRKPAAKPKPAPEAEPESTSAPEAEPETAPAATEITAAELLSAYEVDGEAADARFANQILRVTGVVERIEVKDTLDINYITLTTAETNLLQNVRCTFDKKHGPELSQLTAGQTVTVQGKYDGSMIDISLRDCVLVH